MPETPTKTDIPSDTPTCVVIEVDGSVFTLPDHGRE